MSVAAIDLGTNSLRLLVLSDDGAPLHRETRIVRLGEGVDASRRITPAALARVRAVLGEYRELTADVRALRMVATSAARGASNADELSALVRQELGVPLDIISGAQEAQLTFAGAAAGLVDEVQGDLLVVDIGGGSTEFVRGRGASITHSCSVDLGSVRLTERALPSNLPTPREVEAAASIINGLLDDACAQVPLAGLTGVVGVAGTVTTVTTVALGLPRYDAARVHGAVLPIDDVRATCRRILSLPVAGRLELGEIPQGRADVIGAGALIWDLILERVAAAAGLTSTITSEADILDGVARDLLRSESAAT